MVSVAMLPQMRASYPRLHFVSDRVLLEALATTTDLSTLPSTLLDTCFQVGGLYTYI